MSNSNYSPMYLLDVVLTMILFHKCNETCSKIVIEALQIAGLRFVLRVYFVAEDWALYVWKMR